MILMKIKGIPVAFWQFKHFSISSQRSCPTIDPYNSSKRLSNCFKLGRIEDAEKLFDDMPDKDVVSYSIMIHGYAKNGFHRKSMGLYSHMRKLGLDPNSFTVVGVIVSTAGLRSSVLGQSVHGLVVKTGLESDTIVVTAILDMYAKCGTMIDSYKVFKGLKSPGLISCNAVVAGFVHNKLFEEGLLLFNQFRKSGLVPNAATVLGLIRGCIALESKRLCECIHGLIVKFALVFDVSVNNSILDMYSSLTDLDAAAKIFGEMEGKDVISWTTMMGLMIGLEYASNALELFCKMRDSGIRHDTVVIINLISACAILRDLKRGRQVHAQAVVCGFGSEISLANSLIAMYSKCSDLYSSRTIFDQTTQKSLVSWTAMILGCAQNGHPREALNLLAEARLEENFCLDPTMLIGALTASGGLAAFELCQQLHCFTFEAGFSSYRPVQNSLLSTYSKCGMVELAHDVFKEMGYLRDVVSWNAILNGYGINGHGKTAITLYHEMRRCGEDPDSATYLCILSACSHAGLVNDGLVIFNQMVEMNRIKPSEEHYGCVVDLLARAGCLPDAIGFARKFLEGMGRNVWRALLSGCLLHGNVRLAELAASKICERDPEGYDQVVLLSNVYASVGRFQDAESLRSSLKKKGLLKNPGISLLNGIPYDFG
ncbi:pentatricopeptide repeat-containing protein DOT4, chloroplastic-like [Corylus avellana]|uniref:pentatricopeptide repeat-containing protein DOT4, chloroplastic-like n=1 Tax=Corylus avellana TaxID=13451 RepID=UPI00286D4640|nr:pentatricopeptide repeat-containing protein DOT4, chloroplastic-like [Corylus avellana]XP_059445601.1 pentatricopeptide repeat-containing protein DOT4, chloroplastic-like [Corylus avellana]XP_059445608.1 pentatricopeptide repeat-containing protein DOT4, chloroplastic-like [Corylus avellana]